MKINKKLTAKIVKDHNSGWACVVRPELVTTLGHYPESRIGYIATFQAV